MLNISPIRLLSCPHSRVSLPIAPWWCMSRSYVFMSAAVINKISAAVPAAGISLLIHLELLMCI